MTLKRFNIRVYGLLLDQGRVLVSDEFIRGQRVTKFPGGGLELGEGTKDCLIRELREEMELNFRIEVDGGVAHDTVAQVVEAGADMLVAGSAVFSPGKTERNARKLLKLARAAAPRQS